MACTSEFIESVCDTLRPLGEVRSRKMMGDYVIYVNGKCVITACDNLAYVKKLPCIADLMTDAETGFPYQGAKEAYILNFAETRKILKVIETLWSDLPYPKSKAKKPGMHDAVALYNNVVHGASRDSGIETHQKSKKS